MLQIKNNKVFVNGKETTDATLIGLAFIDVAETLNDKESLIIYDDMIVDDMRIYMEGKLKI